MQATMSLLTRSRCPRRFFGKLDEAVTWIVPWVRDNAYHGTSRGALSEAFTQFCAQVSAI